MNIFDSSLNSNRKLKYFSVEVITFDGKWKIRAAVTT